MKPKRQFKILSLIKDVEIDTQEMLQKLLSEIGYDVTQATISRDIKELGLVKIPASNGGNRYSLPDNRALKPEYSAILANAVVSTDFAINTAVLKCHTGMAQAACAAIDSMEFEKVVGTIAGDDTIFVLLKTERDAREFNTKISQMLMM